MFELLIVDGPEKGLKFDLKAKTTYVGRSKNCDIRIKDFTVSRRHLRCTVLADTFDIEDLKSVNGTVIDGQRIRAGDPVSTCPGSFIRLGKTIITLRRLTRHKLDPALKEKVYSGSDSRARDQRHVEMLNDVALMVTDTTLGVPATADGVLKRVRLFLPRVDRAALFVYLPSSHTIQEVASRPDLESGSLSYGTQSVEKAIRESVPIILFDAESEKIPEAEELRHKQIRSLLCLPLYRKTRAVGALYLDSMRGPHAFRKADVAVLEHVCALISVYLQREWPDPLIE